MPRPAATREIGGALGVAVVRTVLASHFGSGLPPALHRYGNSVSAALDAARTLGATPRAQAVSAFTGAMATGYRMVAVIVLIGAVATAAGFPRARREATTQAR